MRLHLDETQTQVIDAIDRLSEQLGGVEHLRKVHDGGSFDEAAFKALAEAGFLSLALEPGLGPVEGALVANRVALRGHPAAVGATALVYPLLTGRAATGPAALAPGKAGVPFRFAPVAAHVLIDGGDEALLLDAGLGDIVRVENDRAGPMLGKLTDAGLARARSLGPGTGAKLRQWWQVALAAEAAGAMRGAIDTTARYLTERVQFGRPLATFQALQHRLAHLAVRIEATYWLAMEAAFRQDSPDFAAVAATQAVATAPLAFSECQQMHGAMGFTREYPLHVWTMQLPALQRELGGLSAHARAAAVLRYAA